ncbi:MAG: type II secretion system ATPase GspE [Sorangiineae bacterium]|nr:type II secretion system ATPase GspE [Polyangiaceae bacterium]MEB2321914.1 type II secretion system ATPase GspE [Sorangiineae bacterium]
MLEQRALGDILVRRGVVTLDALEPLYAQQRDRGTGLVELVVQSQLASDHQVARALAAECGLGFVERIEAESVPLAIATRIPIGYARSHKLLVVSETDDVVEVICGDPLDTAALDDVRAMFEKPVVAQVALPDVVADAIMRVYERQDTSSELESSHEFGADEAIDILESDEEAPIIRWVNNLFSQAVKERASDIHIEPEEKEVLVRYRIDGQLYVARRASRQFMSAVVARVKIMAGLNIAEKRLPQDGRISLRIAGRAIDVRVSTIPTSRDAERIVMRLLHKTNVLLELTELGFSERDYRLMDQLVHRPNGIILVTGPTGSGKTTTLYACLNKINRPNINILTAEDPVEYEIGGIHQVAVQPKIGLTFASALRAFLRQDPDVIMVGEIRDRETAEIAIHASMTGHLVLSTIHTNDAAGAVTRLVEMEIEPFLVRSTVIGILAQRLVRVLCEDCKEPYQATPFELQQLGIDPERTRRRDQRVLSPRYLTHDANYVPVGWREPTMPTFFRARGCERCDNKGYSGRRGIYELLIADDAVGSLILQNADAQAIKRAAQAQGMDSLRDDGARKVLLGRTTVEEVVAATQEDVFLD